MDTLIDQTAATRAIVAAFGGITAKARELGHKNASTVQGWNDRGNIPALQQPLVLEHARRLNLPIGPQHFLTPLPVAA